MLRFFLTLLFAFVIGMSSAFAQTTTAFLSILPDVPLMPVLQESSETAMIFDKPEGRIAVAEATGQTDISDVERYYQQALPQLGWKYDDERDVFLREDEILDISFMMMDNTLQVKFMLNPR